MQNPVHAGSRNAMQHAAQCRRVGAADRVRGLAFHKSQRIGRVICNLALPDVTMSMHLGLNPTEMPYLSGYSSTTC
jgi:hypothetical protein